MTNEQAQKVLNELQGVRPEQLNGEARRLFEAIMKIADERDELKEETEMKDKQIEKYQNMLVTNDLLHIKESQEKDKQIDLMSEQLTTPIHDKNWVKEYYEKKTKEGKKNEN